MYLCMYLCYVYVYVCIVYVYIDRHDSIVVYQLVDSIGESFIMGPMLIGMRYLFMYLFSY